VGFFSDLKTRRAIAALDERIETVERQLKGVKLEWESTYDKLHRIVQRISKRAERAEELEPREDGHDSSAPPVETGAPQAGAGLSQRQREIQQQILRHRAGMR